MSSRTNAQVTLPAAGLPKREQGSPLLSKQEQQPQPLAVDADADAALLFDEALSTAGISSDEAAFLMGVSSDMVRKMRRPQARERVAFAQMLRLPPAFHVALHRVLNRRYGFGRAALGRALDALGDLAFAGDL